MFKDRNGLITSSPYGNTEENSFLYTVELFVITKLKGRCTLELEMTLEHAVSLMHLGSGIYKQNPDYPAPALHRSKDRYMSHDQLTALLVYFKLTGQQEKIQEVMDNFKYGISYNNDTEEKKLRIFHPRDIIFYNILNGSKIAYLFLPLLYLITMFTFMKDKKRRPHGVFKKTDGEILYYIKRTASNVFKPINVFCNLLIKFRFGSWDKVFSTYFKQIDHPINIIRNK